MHQVQVHSDLIEDHHQFNAWRPNTSFPVADLTKSETEKIKGYSINEHVFGGVGSSRDSVLFDQKFSSFITGMKRIIYGDGDDTQRSVYLFAAEHKAQPPSRIRSYKGIVPSQWKDRVRINERELAIAGNLTVLSFVAELTKDHFPEASAFFMDDARSFIVNSSKKEVGEFLLLHSNDFLSTKGNVQINYAKLLLSLSTQDVIYRVGGNKGEDYWSVQEFVSTVPAPLH